MSKHNINPRIQEEVDEVDDGDIRQFIGEALAYERSKLDLDQPHFRQEYNHLVETYAAIDEDDTEGGE